MWVKVLLFGAGLVAVVAFLTWLSVMLALGFLVAALGGVGKTVRMLPRTALAKPYYLYVVKWNSYQKHGRGTRQRIEKHVRHGATVQQVLAGGRPEVLLAERNVNRRWRPAAKGRVPGMPPPLGRVPR